MFIIITIRVSTISSKNIEVAAKHPTPALHHTVAAVVRPSMVFFFVK